MPTATPAIREYVEQTFGRFIREEINPTVLARDSAGESISRAHFRKACELGLTTYALPKDIGGGGHDVLSWGQVLEHVGYVCQDSCLPFVVSLRASVIKTIYRSGRVDLIERYVHPMVAGERAPAFAYTDGADPFSFNTSATAVEGGFRLNGRKLFVTGGATADTFMVYARSSQSQTGDLQVFLVDREDAGVRISQANVAGLKTAGISTLELNNVLLPVDRALVLQDGLSHVQQFLNERRIYLACPLLGRMEAMLEDCISSLDQKVRYGNPLTAMQNVQAQIGRMFHMIETCRSTLYRGLEHQSTDEFDPYWDALGCVAKSLIVDQAIELGNAVQRLLGGDGYLRENHFERYLRDFQGYIPGGGSQDTLMVDLGVQAISAFEAKRLRQLARPNVIHQGEKSCI